MAGPRKRDWCWTVHAGHFGEHESEAAVIEGLKQTDCVYMVFQQERGSAREGGIARDHIQGYVMFKAAKTLPAAQTALGVHCHMEVRRAKKISDAINYCKKDDTRRAMWWEKGIEPMDQGEKRTLEEACMLVKQQGIKRVARDMPEMYVRHEKGLRSLEHITAGDAMPMQRPVKVYYLWGDSGCGKTWWASSIFDSPVNTYVTYDMPEKIWMGSYAGERTLVINDFDGSCAPGLFKNMLEGTKMEFQTKGGHAWGQWDTVIITSNMDPSVVYTAKDNPWSVHPTQPDGPFQRRFKTGGIIQGKGRFEKGTAVFDTNLPMRDEEAVAPDSGAAPDVPDVDLTMDDPGVTVEPTTADIMNSLTIGGLDLDEFLNM